MRSYRKASCSSALFSAAFLLACLPINVLAVTSIFPIISNRPYSLPLSFSLPIYPWNTCQGFITGLLIIAVIALTVFFSQQRRFRRKAHQLEKLVSARTQELAMANADLERLSVTDPLTGLKNRRFVEFSIVDDLARVRRSYQCVQGEWRSITAEVACINFLLIDIDHFKEVNDRYGHPAGDQVLRQMGSLFTSMVRESDTIVRWGGEEFLIVARNPKGNDLSIMAERIRKQVEAIPFAVNDQKNISLTCSIGFSSWPFFKKDPDALSWEDIIGIADRALYMAKKSGRNTWYGIFPHAEYQGKIHANLFNDPVMAEKQGVIQIQSITALDHSRLPQSPHQNTSYPIHIV
jgi:diguanylate cyclase (GGDEF)-like protein